MKNKRCIKPILVVLLLVSFFLNCVICIKYNILKQELTLICENQNESVSGVESQVQYLENPQYNARLSTFELYGEDADIVFVGDSITEKANWNELFPSVDCINRGIGSDTTEGVIRRIDEIMSHHPSKIFILIGINDLALGISSEQAAVNMESIIDKIHTASPDCNLYVESVLYARDIDNNDVDDLNRRYKQLCFDKEYATYVELNTELCGGVQEGQLYSADGVHLSGDGYKAIIKILDRFVYDEIIDGNLQGYFMKREILGAIIEKALIIDPLAANKFINFFRKELAWTEKKGMRK